MKINVKRVYEPYDKTDGYRILVDRLWPRGLTKEEAHVDLWLKEISPSNELRKWFHQQDPDWKVFTSKYKAELKETNGLAILKESMEGHNVVTLVFAAKNELQNQAVLLKQLLSKS